MKNQEPTAELIAFLGSLQLVVNEHGEAQCLGMTQKEYATLTVRGRAAGAVAHENGALSIEANDRRVVLKPSVLGDRPLVSAWNLTPAPGAAGMREKGEPLACSIRSAIPVMLNLLPPVPRTTIAPGEIELVAEALKSSASEFRYHLGRLLLVAGLPQVAALVAAFPKDIHWAMLAIERAANPAAGANVI